MAQFGVGQGVPRFEDPRLLTGRGSYTDDVTLPGMVRGYVLRSPSAAATIRKMDISAARTAPGVLAVLTAEDYDADGLGIPECSPKRKRRDGKPMFEPRNQGGTESSYMAVHSTRVWPNSTSTLPCALLVKPRVKRISRSWSGARPSWRATSVLPRRFRSSR